jgi:hypothetical protein
MVLLQHFNYFFEVISIAREYHLTAFVYKNNPRIRHHRLYLHLMKIAGDDQTSRTSHPP